jgi:two-component system sensor histidine kinase PilS (NtrC family)
LSTNRGENAALEGLFRYRPAVAIAIIAVALAVDAAGPVPGRRELLVGIGLLATAADLVARMIAPRLHAARYLVLGALAGDVILSSLVVSVMGGATSPFVLLYPLVAFTGGMMLGVRGGVTLGLLAAVSFEVAALAGGGVAPRGDGNSAGWLDAERGRVALRMAFYPVFFTLVGILAGLLGRRMAESERALADAADEMEQLRLDTESIVQNLSSALLTIDRAGRIVHFNRVAETLLGLDARRVRGRKLAEALRPEHRELVGKVEATLQEGLPLLRAEVRFGTDGGESTPVGLSTSVVKDRRGMRCGVVALFQDLTEVRRLEEASRRQDRLSVIGGMAASIAHEVRNCVNPISGSVEMLQSELRLDGENAKLLDLIGREAAKMERLVSELLNFSRGNPMTIEAIVLETLLDRTFDKIRAHPAWRPTVELLRDYGPGPTTVGADAHQLEQVFFNLALNAIESMGPVGSLRVRITPGDPAALGPGAPGTACVEFSDTGVGMSRETLDRIFEPFYTTKGSGTGLGLAIAHRIVERHQGRMEVTSRPRVGTKVRVHLPTGEAVSERLGDAA